MDGAVTVAPSATGDLAARFTAMGTGCEVLADGADAAQAAALGRLAAQECWRIEHKWSRYRQDNIVHTINSAQGRTVEVDEETARLIEFGAQLHLASAGRFDLTSGVLRRAWRFACDAQLPSQAQVEALLDRVGWHRVQWLAPRLRLQPGMEIDFGGIGKEYAADRVCALLEQAARLPVLVNLGGDIAVNRPRRDGSPWRVGIDSGVPGTATPMLYLARGAVATSGDQHRCIQVDGRRYGHTLDPRTGWPPPQAPRSVTVAGDTCAQAGAMSTLAVLQGAQAESWLQAQGVDFHVVR